MILYWDTFLGIFERTQPSGCVLRMPARGLNVKAVPVVYRWPRPYK